MFCIDTFYSSFGLLRIQRWCWFKNLKERKLIFKCIQTFIQSYLLLWVWGRSVTRVLWDWLSPTNMSIHMAYSRAGRATSTEYQALGLKTCKITLFRFFRWALTEVHTTVLFRGWSTRQKFKQDYGIAGLGKKALSLVSPSNSCSSFLSATQHWSLKSFIFHFYKIVV